MASSHSTLLTRKGQTTIPVKFREQLGLEEGDRLIWTYSDGELKVASAREFVRRTAGAFKDCVPPLPPGGLEQRLAEEKEAAAHGWTERWERFTAENAE